MKTRVLGMVLLALVMVGQVMGQPLPDTLWTRTYGGASDEWVSSFIEDHDGNLVIGGTTYSFGIDNKDMYLLILEEDGSLIQEIVWGTDGNEELSSVIEVSSGGYLLMGHTDEGSNDTDGIIVRMNEVGDTLWTRRFDKGRSEWAVNGYEDETGNLIVLYSSGTYIGQCSDRDCSGIGIKYSSLGEILDDSLPIAGADIGGYGSSVVLYAETIPEGGFLTAGIGWVDPPPPGDPPYTFGFFNMADLIHWCSWLGGGTRTNFIRNTIDNEFIAISRFTLSGPPGDSFFSVHKGSYAITDEDCGLSEDWSVELQMIPCRAVVGTQQGYAVVGYRYEYPFNNEVTLAKLDSAGNQLWMRTYGGDMNDFGTDILRTDDSCYVIAGTTRSFGAGGRDIYLIKTGPDTALFEAANSPATFPLDYRLIRNFPNPFNPITEIEYDIAKTGDVSLRVYDVLGREVATLANGLKSAGNYTVKFNGTELPSGVYIYRLQAGDFTQSRKMVLLK